MDASYLSQQVNAIIGQLHGLFDEIGVPNHDREKREEELFNALSEALHNQVRLVTHEKQEMLDDAQRTINAIRQMEASLDDSRPRRDYEGDDLQVTYPLSRCLQVLRDKHLQISKIHRERFEQVKKLADALESYSSHLESTFVRIALPPTGPNQSVPLNFDLSPSYVDKLDAEFTRVYDEYTRRVATVKALSENIIQLWAELGTPQAQTDAAIVQNYRDSPEQLGLHEEDLARLRARRDKLADEKRAREKRLRDLKAAVEVLWGKLGVEEHEQKAFVNSNRGCGMRQINEYEDELARLNEQKRQNLPAFVEDARCKLQELWDVLYLSEDEMLEFTPAFSDVYSDALLEAHEREIARLETLRDQRAPMLAIVERHQTLIRERDDLAASSQDASRLMMRGQKGEKRDPGKLLREEKMRKRIAKELPKVTAELTKLLEAWEDEYGRPFLVHGERYLASVYGEKRGAGAAATAAAGPRSKTPACPPSASVKSAGKHTPGQLALQQQQNIPGSQLQQQQNIAGSRAGAKTPTASMASTAGNGSKRMPTATTNNGRLSPSRIPARAPLGALKHGTNSPERPRANAGMTNGHGGNGGMLRPAPVLMRAPPPKMRELKPVPELDAPSNPYRGTNLAGSIVRHVDLEDVYDDSQQNQNQNQNQNQSQHQYGPARSQSQQSQYSQYSSRPPSSNIDYHEYHGAGSLRQISNTSANISGSENWETYDDNSEPELDASDTYYAKMRAARGKRMTPDNGHGRSAATSQAKRVRGLAPAASSVYAGHVMVDAEGNRVVSGSEWTDEDAF